MTDSLEPEDINPSSQCHICGVIVVMSRMYCNKCVSQFSKVETGRMEWMSAERHKKFETMEKTNHD